MLIDDAGANVDVYNDIVYASATNGIRIGTTLTTGTVRIFNNTVYGNTSAGISASGSNPTATLRNNISHSNGGAEFNVSGLNAASSNNLASDATGTTHSPAGGGINSVSLAAMLFVNTTASSENLHIQAGSAAANVAADLSGFLSIDIDGGVRVSPWDIGADDILATTAVKLLSFEARPLDGAVDLSWETGSEISNLGFHLYRGLSSSGPWDRLTTNLIPGLGSSPQGALYQYRDSSLSNGTTYYYMLEDVETTGRVERHGPVDATPSALASPSGEALPRRHDLWRSQATVSACCRAVLRECASSSRPGLRVSPGRRHRRNRDPRFHPSKKKSGPSGESQLARGHSRPQGGKSSPCEKDRCRR
jgi:hypothetical protein